MNLGNLLIVISVVLFAIIFICVYYFIKEVRLNWEYGHTKDKWPKNAVLESLKVHIRLRMVFTFMLAFFIFAPFSVYFIEEGSPGGTYLALVIISPALVAWYLTRVFTGQIVQLKKLLSE